MSTAILVIEDEAIVARDIAQTLERLHYEVAGIAASGEEALKLLEKPGVNLVLMDIILKGNLDGIETAQQIVTKHNLPVIYLTAHSDPATLEKAKITTPYGYILKPFEERELHTNIEMALYRHQAEKKLKEQAAEMERAHRLEALGTLAGGIAHNLNNLLTIIMGHFWLLETVKDLPDEINSSVEAAQEAIKRAGDLSRQLLTFARGGDPLKLPLALNELVQRVVLPLLQAGGINGEFKLAEDLWSVEADQEQLSLVLRELTQFALMDLPAGDGLKVTTANLSLPEDRIRLQSPTANLEEGKYISLQISFHQKQITSEILTKLFDPFFELLGGRNSLGLSICYSVIRRHDGYLHVKINSQEIVTFQIYLPAHPTVAAVSSENQNTLPGLSSTTRPRVLAMDDEPGLRNMFSMILSRLGYEVTVAREGSEAIEYYRQAQTEQRSFAVVLLDLTVPDGMGGVETLQNLLKLDPEVKAIVSSGYSDDPVMAHYDDYGFKARLSKPYLLRDLLGVLTEVISK